MTETTYQNPNRRPAKMTTTKIETLEAELSANWEARQKLKAKVKQLDAKLGELIIEGNAIERQIHRTQVAALVGQQVQRRYRRSQHPELNDAIGTLTAVRRTRCSVDYGHLGKWSLPIDDVAEAGVEQGMEIFF
jgi:hypothetical protein